VSRKKLGFIDSTLRDGQEALLGGRLRIELVAPILERLDMVGFESIEAWGGGTFSSSLALLHQDPWETLRSLKKGLKRTPLQMLIRGRFLVGNRPFSYGFVERFLSRTAELGVNVVRLVDPLNDLESLTKVAYLAKKAGLIVQFSVLSSDFLNNLDYYEGLISKADLSSADALGIFDPWGTLSPATAMKLIELLQKEKAHRVFAHVHNLRNAGVTSVAAVVEKGASMVDTCFSAFCCDGSLPSIETLFIELVSNRVSSDLDPKALVEASRAFMQLRNENFDRVPAVMQPTSSIEKSLREIPPTFSTLVMQRNSAGQSKDDGGLQQEALKIMNELGLVALMAPISKIIARQAVLNLHSKTRYNDFTDEFLRLLRGEYGPMRIQKGLFKGLRNDLDLESVDEMGEIEERIFMPPDQPKHSKDDVLSFALYPHELVEMKKASLIARRGERQNVVAAALALLAEEDELRKASVHEASSMQMVADSFRWRDALRLDDSDSSRKRGFFQEPF